MTHPTDDELVLLFYREGDSLQEMEAHLASCTGCRRRFEMLTAALRAVEAVEVPERDEAYGAQVWAQLQPRLSEAQGQPGW